MSVNASLFVLCKHHGAILKEKAEREGDGTLDDRLLLMPCPGSIKTTEKLTMGVCTEEVVTGVTQTKHKTQELTQTSGV